MIHFTTQIKTVAISAAVLSMAMMLHLSGPTILQFSLSELPRIYAILVSWLTPPYLYFVVNGIIIYIAASSRFHRSGSEDTVIGSGPASVTVVAAAQPAQVIEDEHENTILLHDQKLTEYSFLTVKQSAKAVKAVSEYSSFTEESPTEKKKETTEYSFLKPAKAVMELTEYSFLTEKPTETEKEATEYSFLTEKRTETEKEATEYSFLTEKPTTRLEKEVTAEYSFLTPERPPVSSRLGRRKSLKSTPEAGKSLRVARPKKNDTLENTWKAITDGRSVPLTRHLKKSDTWETHHHTRAARVDMPAPDPVMRKSETFNEHGGARKKPVAPPLGMSAVTAAGFKLRKEPSLGQDELNRRVEAFINKFNEEMRMQRQESFQHYMDMINRGSHY